MTSNMILLLMFGSLTLFMLTGLPIAFVLGGLSLLFTVTLWEPNAVIVLVLQIFDTMKSEALLAIPLFILMACILQRSGVIEDLYRAMELWFGRLKGGLAIGTVIICVVMAAMTGVVGAAVTAMGILALPEMLRRGYKPELALGTICASGGAVFHLNSNNVRPTAQPRWTSADAAGLPIFPGLVRYDEAVLGPGGIRHALRFTVSQTRRAYVPPATHWASGNTSPNLPPMGMRVRLKASYVIPAGFSAETRAILTALKTHGMMVADNGSNWYLSGAPDERWNNDRLKSELRQVLGRDFEVVRMDGLVTP